jgi:SOS response regulatory protein OraA/RecX
LLDEKAVPERALKLTNSRKLAGRGFTAFYAFNKSPEELGLTDHNYFIYDSSNTVEMYKSMETMHKNFGQATCVLNNADPNCSPKGTTIMYTTTLFTTDVWKDVKEEEYYKLKNKIALSMLKRFEDVLGVSLQEHIEEIDGILDVHHIHLWSLDGQNHYATMHIVSDSEPSKIKKEIREELRELGIGHVTIEIEASSEHCHERHCHVELHAHSGHCHHNHHHHG